MLGVSLAIEGVYCSWVYSGLAMRVHYIRESPVRQQPLVMHLQSLPVHVSDNSSFVFRVF